MNPVEDISRPHCLNFSEDASVIAEPAKPGIAMVTPKNRIGRRSLIPTPCYQVVHWNRVVLLYAEQRCPHFMGLDFTVYIGVLISQGCIQKCQCPHFRVLE